MLSAALCVEGILSFESKTKPKAHTDAERENVGRHKNRNDHRNRPKHRHVEIGKQSELPRQRHTLKKIDLN